MVNPERQEKEGLASLSKGIRPQNIRFNIPEYVRRGGLVDIALDSWSGGPRFESQKHHVISLGKEFTHIAQVNSQPSTLIGWEMSTSFGWSQS
jgi:hypothetical protein